MIINHNIAALNTYRQLTNNNVMGNKALEKLSSGLRINRAADDAAGLAISEKMRGQVRGLNQACATPRTGSP
jgi:flagellin